MPPNDDFQLALDVVPELLTDSDPVKAREGHGVEAWRGGRT
jgi:hypothetical protein